MRELDDKESWAPKNWCFWSVMLEKTLESPLDSKIKLVNPKGNKSWIFIGRSDAEAEIPILWLHDAKNWPMEGPWCTERLKAGGEGDDRGWDDWMASLTWWPWVWASSEIWQWTEKPGMLRSMGWKELDTTEQLNWTEQDILSKNSIVLIIFQCIWTILQRDHMQGHKKPQLI